MVSFKPAIIRKHVAAGGAGLCMALLAGVALSGAAFAQQPEKPAAAKPDAKKDGGSEKSSGSAWVKLCEEQKGDKKGNVCLTHHERFHPTTGQPLISAAIRKIDGQEGETVMIMVPLGRLLPAGLLLKIDEDKPLKLDYGYCTALGCVAEAKANPELLGKLKKGKEITIGTIDITQKRIGFKVPLTGFTTAYDGPPIDRKVYAQARKEMFDKIRARQIELVKRAKEAAEKKKAAGGADPAGDKKKTQ